MPDALPTSTFLSLHKPWSFRDRLVPTRTYSGRVVYDRKPHAFTVRDLERISARVDVNKASPDQSFSLLEKLVRFIWQLIFAIVPIPGILEGVPQIFTDFYVNWMHDSRVAMPVLDAFNKNGKIFLSRLIEVMYGNMANFIQEQGGTIDAT